MKFRKPFKIQEGKIYKAKYRYYKDSEIFGKTIIVRAMFKASQKIRGQEWWNCEYFDKNLTFFTSDFLSEVI